jgi:hypothetical protein
MSQKRSYLRRGIVDQRISMTEQTGIKVNLGQLFSRIQRIGK